MSRPFFDQMDHLIFLNELVFEINVCRTNYTRSNRRSVNDATNLDRILLNSYYIVDYYREDDYYRR